MWQNRRKYPQVSLNVPSGVTGAAVSQFCCLQWDEIFTLVSTISSKCHWRSCMEPFFVFFHYCFPNYFSCSGRGCNPGSLWSFRNILQTRRLYLILHQHGGDLIISEMAFSGVDCSFNGDSELQNSRFHSNLTISVSHGALSTDRHYGTFYSMKCIRQPLIDHLLIKILL